MIYLDCDGTILDTTALIFEYWKKIPDRHSLSPIEKIKYLQRIDWYYILNNSKPINDSLYNLKQMDPKESAILTKVHSLENEGQRKIEFFRESGIKQPIILVPHTCKKTDVVQAQGNTLVDDNLGALEDWEKCNGNPIFFDPDGDGCDMWHKKNDRCYKMVKDLSNIGRSL